MNLPKIVFINSKEIVGGELMLCTEKPYILIRAYKFESSKKLEGFLIKYNLLEYALDVPGYNILLCHVGQLASPANGPLLGLGKKHIDPELTITLKDALNFYEENRIKGNETRLKKFERL